MLNLLAFTFILIFSIDISLENIGLINRGDGNVSSIDALIDADNTVHIVWSDNSDSSHYKIYYTHFNPSTGEKSPVLLLSRSNQSSFHPVINLYRNNIIAFWDGSFASKKSLFYSIFKRGEWWMEPITLSLNESAAYEPYSVSTNDAIFLLWAGEQNNNEDIFISRYFNNIWSKPFCISNNKQESVHTSAAIDSRGYIHIVWQDVQNGFRVIMYSRFKDGKYTKAVRVSPEGENSTRPSIAIDKNDGIHIAWLEHKSIPNAIHYLMMGSKQTYRHSQKGMLYLKPDIISLENSMLIITVFRYIPGKENSGEIVIYVKNNGIWNEKVIINNLNEPPAYKILFKDLKNAFFIFSKKKANKLDILIEKMLLF